jgi:DNA-binding XRE family transcriptional regulator
VVRKVQVRAPDGAADDFASRIRQHRLDNALSQAAFGQKLGVTQQTVARWETGAPVSTRCVPRLRVALGIDQAINEATLAEVVMLPLPPRATDVKNDGSHAPTQDVRAAFVEACVERLRDGAWLPDRVVVLLAEYLL